MVQGQAAAPKAPDKRNKNVSTNLTVIAIFSPTFFIHRDRCISKPPRNCGVLFLFIPANGGSEESRTEPTGLRGFRLSATGCSNRSNGLRLQSDLTEQIESTNAPARPYKRIPNQEFFFRR